MRLKFDTRGVVTLGLAGTVLMAMLAGCDAQSDAADAPAAPAAAAATDPLEAVDAPAPASAPQGNALVASTDDDRFERFVQALQSCRSSTYDQPHPLVADFTVVHTVHGKDRDRCEYSQTMPGGMRMVCMLDAEGVAALVEAQRKWLAGGPLQASSSAGFEQQCEFSGKPVATMPNAIDPPAASAPAVADATAQAAPAPLKVSAVVHDYVPMPDDGSETTEHVGPGVKVVDPSGKVLVDGTQTDWVEVPRQ